MHSFNLGLQSLVAHSWSRTLISQAQRIVTYVRASPPATAAIASAAKLEGIKSRLCSGNATRFISNIRMTQRLLLLQPALKRVAARQPAIFKPEVHAIILSRDFWDDLSVLIPILEPFAAAITAIQANAATLADVLLHWLRLAAAIQTQLPRLPRGMLGIVLKYLIWLSICQSLSLLFQGLRFSNAVMWCAEYREHVVRAFNRRCLEMDTLLHHLALFLDPRFRTVMSKDGKFPKLVKLVSNQPTWQQEV